MRFWLLGGLLLVGLFLLSRRLQERWTSDVRAERDALHDAGGLPARDDAETWGRVIVGRPSGADAVRTLEPAPASAARAPSAAPAGSAGVEAALKPSPAAAKAPSKWTVKPGDTLSEIVRAHYGHAPHAWVQAVARANHLEDASALRAGVELQLPPISELERR